MKLKNYNVYFFFGILFGITILTFFIFKPFMIPCLLAAVLAHLFFPFYKKMLKITKKKQGLSALVVILASILLIVIPLTFLGSLIIKESQNIINNFSSENNNIEKIISDSMYNFSHLSIWGNFQVEKFINQEEIIKVINNFSKNTLSVLQGAYKSLSSLVLNIFIMFFAFFYFLIDGKRLVEKIKEISPIRDKYEEVLLKRFNFIIKALMRGTLLIAVIQGALCGILFWATGVTSPIILGVIAAILSFLPTVGAGIVWTPVGIIMIILGHPIEGIIIILVGALIISTIDNFLRPKIMGKNSQVHPLLILLSTLGGLITFGLAGFIIGPILMALFLVMWEIYSLEFKEQLKEFNG